MELFDPNWILYPIDDWTWIDYLGASKPDGEVMSTSAQSLQPPMSPEMKQWRLKVFTSTWLTYFGFYFCRKAFYAVKGTLAEDLVIDETQLGYIGFTYLLCYTIGQFTAVGTGRLLGARNLLLVGMATSLITNIIFGFAANVWTIMVFMGINGFAQATGWPSTIGIMANWTTRSERGTVMGLWTTCYQFGGVAATAWAAWWLSMQGWRGAFFAASSVLTLIWFYVYFFVRNAPEDVGLSLSEEDEDAVESSEPESVEEVTEDDGKMFSAGVAQTVFLVGSFYFFVKFVRYALWSWAPFLLDTQFGLDADTAGYMSTLFDLFGFAGAVTAGFLSDKYFNGRRTVISILMLIGMVIGCCILYWAGTMASNPAFGPDLVLLTCGAGLSMIGFMLFGPDSLLTGAGAMDLGSKKSALAAAGIINGMGSIGSMAQEIVLPKVMEYSKDGVDFAGIGFTATEATFAVLILASMMSICPLLVVRMRNKQGKSDL